MDAWIVRSESLRGFLGDHRAELLQQYLQVFRAHQQAAVGSQYDYGLKHGPFSVGLNAKTPDLLQQILVAIAASLPDYDLYTPELFFGTGRPVRPHNDVSLFLRSGQEVAIQLWILLESCLLTRAGAAETRCRNALEVCTTVAAGPVFAGTSYVLTPEGRQSLSLEPAIGGDSLENGDILLFKNGCVHFTRAVQQQGLFRAALAVRAIRKDRQEDANYLRWMKQVWASDEQLQGEARGTYVSSARRMLLDSADDQPPDRSRLLKLDANDYEALIASLQQVVPGRAVLEPLAYIDLRTAQSLVVE
jgi:hypothetical protein